MEDPPKELIEKPKEALTPESEYKQERWTEVVKKRKIRSSETAQKSTSATPGKSPAKVTPQDPVNKRAPVKTYSSPPLSRKKKQPKETIIEELMEVTCA